MPPVRPRPRILGRHLVDRVWAQADAGDLSPEAAQLFVCGLLTADDNGVISPDALAWAGELAEAGAVDVQPFKEDAGYYVLTYRPHHDPTSTIRRRKR